MSPVNKPDPFETRALERIRSDGLTEHVELLPGQFRYARTLRHEASCITCHGSVEKAPNDLKVRDGTERGFAFKEGGVARVVRVRAPTKPLLEVSLSVIAPRQTALVVAAFLVSCFFTRTAVVKPVQRLTAATASGVV